MDISIIIVNYNSARMVADCINSIAEKTEGVGYEIIVVDNASKDHSVALLEKAFGSQITVIASDINLGFGKANNLGVMYASGKYLFFLNPDTILVNNAIQYLYLYLEKHPETGIAGGNLYTPDMEPAPSHCMVFDDLETEREKASWRKILFGKVKQKLSDKKIKEKKQFVDEFNYLEQEKQVAYVFGADMMMKREVFESAGGFDPDFFMYAEEEYLSWRITQKGYRIVNVPQARIIHLEGATLKGQDEFSERQFKMRMNGTMTYFKKRFGAEGVQKFYEFRSLRYKRLIQIARWQRKLTDTFTPVIQKKCLDEEFRNFSK